MTSDEDNNDVKVRCGLDWSSASVNGVKQNIKIDDDNMPYVAVTLSKGQSVTVDFELTDKNGSVTVTTSTDTSKTVLRDNNGI